MVVTDSLFATERQFALLLTNILLRPCCTFFNVPGGLELGTKLKLRRYNQSPRLVGRCYVAVASAEKRRQPARDTFGVRNSPTLRVTPMVEMRCPFTTTTFDDNFQLYA